MKRTLRDTTQKSKREPIITPERDAKRLEDLNGELVPEMDTLRGARGEPTWARSFKWPLDFYFRREHITGAQHRAGCDYHRLWRNGVIHSGYAQVKYEVRTTGSTGGDANYSTEVEYKAATEAILGYSKKEVAYTVCCLGVRAGRGNISFLRDALNDLYHHFRLVRGNAHRANSDAH